MALGKWIILTVLLGFVGTIQSQSILLTSKQFDFYAKALIERNGLNDSLQECKEELRECNRMVNNLELKVTGTEVAMESETRIANSYRLSYAVLSERYDKKVKWNKRFKKVIIAVSAFAILEGTLLYFVTR